MSQHSVNTNQCSKDAVCVRVCPANRLRVGSLGFPEVNPALACLSCGHCVSVCPTSALTLPHVANADLEVLAEDWRIGSERVAHFLKGRRSTRVYQDQPLENATIEELIRVAQYAPSGHNSQPLGWTVVSQRERVRAITETTVDWMRLAMAQGSSLVTPLNMPAVVTAWDSGHDTISRGAPHLVIAHAPEQLPTGAHAAAIAITYFDLAATSRGLGTCWAGFVFVGAGASPAVHAALGLPNGQRCAGAVFVGYPAIPFRRIPARRTPTIRWT